MLDGFQPRERNGGPRGRRAMAGSTGSRRLEGPGEQRTGTVVKTVPVGVIARMELE
ncbi:hypothetical protein ACFFRL_16635 [Agromyces hippuratus]|uniref:hypothetical protein n=1 Tax=Agromyces hippuratus TaxID=286438 RepID=UPI0035ED6C87